MIINDIKVTGNYESADIVAPFSNYCCRMSHTIVSLNAMIRTTVNLLYEHGVPDLQLILPILLSTLARSRLPYSLPTQPKHFMQQACNIKKFS